MLQSERNKKEERHRGRQCCRERERNKKEERHRGRICCRVRETRMRRGIEEDNVAE